MIQDEILQRLKDMQDITYRDFQAKLVPTVDKENSIGVRIPDLRKLAKEHSVVLGSGIDKAGIIEKLLPVLSEQPEPEPQDPADGQPRRPF